MTTPAATLWVDGEFRSASTAIFEVTDRGAALGDGLFETIKINASQPCCFHRHWARLSQSASVLHLPILFGMSVIEHAIVTLAKTNAVGDGAARLMVSRGKGARGPGLPKTPAPCMILSVTSGLPVFDEPPTLGLSTMRRNPWSVSCVHKTLSYIDNIAARMQQQGTACRDEVVMLDCAGHVASASVANLFWLDEHGLHTPSLECAILPGTMRARVLDCAERLNIDIRQGACQPAAILNAKAAFMTNALIGIQMLSGLDFGTLGRARFTQDHDQIAQLRNALTAR